MSARKDTPYTRDDVVKVLAGMFGFVNDKYKITVSDGETSHDATDVFQEMLLRACELIGNAYGVSQAEVCSTLEQGGWEHGERRTKREAVRMERRKPYDPRDEFPSVWIEKDDKGLRVWFRPDGHGSPLLRVYRWDASAQHLREFEDGTYGRKFESVAAAERYLEHALGYTIKREKDGD